MAVFTDTQPPFTLARGHWTNTEPAIIKLPVDALLIQRSALLGYIKYKFIKSLQAFLVFLHLMLKHT